MLAILEHVEERLGERGKRTALVAGQAGDLFSNELVGQDQKGQAKGFPSERLELFDVRDRPFLDRELTYDKILKGHEEPIEAIHEFFFKRNSDNSLVDLRHLDEIISSRRQPRLLSDSLRAEPHLADFIEGDRTK